MHVRNRGNTWVIAMLVCASLVVSAVASAVSTDSLQDAGGSAQSPPATSKSPSVAPKTALREQAPIPAMTPQMRKTALAAARAFPWPTQLLTGLGPYQSWSSGLFQQGTTVPYAFAEVTAGTRRGSITGTYLARIDLSTGVIELGQRTSGVPTQVGSQISLSIPAGTTARGAPVGPWHLAWVKPGVPKAGGNELVPKAGKGEWLPIASLVDERSAGYVWAFCANQIFEVDLATGAPTHIVSFNDAGSAHASTSLDCGVEAPNPQVQNPELSFGGGDLYIPVDYLPADPTARVPVRIFELALPSERVEGSVALANAISGPTLAPVPGGVWATYRTGNMGGAKLFSSQRLALTASWYPKGATPYPVWALSARRATWIQSGTQISCVTPGRSDVLATTAIPLEDPELDAAADWNGRLFATVANNAILVITPPTSCNA
ncbi:MAG: hypothetical protein M0Z88_02610 [Actinomycetota bacterium]|nr:hypothetical protein [Actinomycetota bacterium]